MQQHTSQKKYLEKYPKKLSRGFTLVETLVAISILSLSIIATFTAVQAGLQDSGISKERITVFYLTQEAMEFIKNVRDQNTLQSIKNSPTPYYWLAGLTGTPAGPGGGPCDFGNTCTIDANVGPTFGIANCSGGLGHCPNLNQDTNPASPTYGLYGYNSSWPVTAYKREIQFTPISADEVFATIRVSWTTRGVSNSFQVSEELFNRQ